jgi:SAM-dependent methyltransferase
MQTEVATAPHRASGANQRARQLDAVWSAASVRDAAQLGQYWLAHPMVQTRVNLLASGRSEADAYERLAELLTQRGYTLPIREAISLGCGFGALERDLTRRGLVRQILGLDLAKSAIEEARRLAAAESFSGISYRVVDLEGACLPPRSADVVLAHQSIHHVESLDVLFLAIRRALRPGGVLHLHEFVGPNRFQWTDAQLELVNGFLATLPPRLRRTPTGSEKIRLARPTIASMLAADPTEAIRSAEIPAALRRHFDVIEERPLGGALLHLALGDIAQNFHIEDREARAALENLFALEDRAMRSGRISSDFVAVTAVPRHLTPRYLFQRAICAIAALHRPIALSGETRSLYEISFDEQFYLDAYPDVRQAVAEGFFANGLEHWLRFGQEEGRRGSP